MTPSKVEISHQEACIEFHLELQEKTCKNEPIVFMDLANPPIATKFSMAWIRKGTKKLIFKTRGQEQALTSQKRWNETQ